MGTSRTKIVVCLIALLSLVLLLSGCGGGGGGGSSDSPAEESSSSIAVAQSADGTSIVAADVDGNVLVNDLEARSITLVNSDRSEGSVIYYDSDNFPTKTVIGEYVILYSNWTASTVDIAMIAPDKTYKIQRGVPIDANLLSLAATSAESASMLASSALHSNKWLSSRFKSIYATQKAVVCNIGEILVGLGVPRDRLNWPCQTTLLTEIGSRPDDHDWEQEQNSWGNVHGIPCSDRSSCASSLADMADQVNSEALDTISQDSEAISKAQNDLQSRADQNTGTPLVVGIASPENGTTITSGQSVSLRGSTTGGTGPFTFQWTINGGSISSSTAQNPGNVTFSIPGTYTISFLVTDSGNQTSSSTINITVRSAVTPPPADTTPPSISSVTPANNSVNIAINTPITLTFSESVNPATVTASTFVVTAGTSGITVSGTVNCTGTTATFTPSSPLAYGTTHTATITTGVRDLAGNPFDSNASWTFTTLPNPLNGLSTLLNSMVYIPGGTFQMGSTQDSNAQPVHTVTLAGFEIGAYEVTQAQYLAVTGTNPSSYQGAGRENCPVTNVTWYAARNFCTQLSALTGRTFTLPSEAQWEYACRAGTTATYSFGDDYMLLGDYAWYYDNTYLLGINGAQPVGTKQPNPWGLYDMHGNVWEWCQDSWHDSYAGAPADGSAWEPETGTYRVPRGGDWRVSGPAYCRSAGRYYRAMPDYCDTGLGFRVVAVPDDGLVAYYPFNGNANDESGHGNNGTINGPTLTTDRFGNANSAYNFDGINDYIGCGSNPSTMPASQVTVSVWIKSNASQTGYIVGRNYGNLDGYQVLLSNQQIAQQTLARFGVDNSLNYSDAPLATGEWHHLAMTYDSTHLRGYVDGELQSTIGDGVGAINSAINNLRIGLQGPNDAGYATSYPFNGCIDDIRIYTRALSSNEIHDLFIQEGGDQIADIDNDGLDFATELLLGTDPDDADTDDDGILDGQEDSNHNGTVDLWETNPLNFDTDGDGIQDGTELGITLAMVGPATDPAVFQPDLDPTTTTSAVSSDTDGDSISDGVEDTNGNGRVDAGEHDPNVFTDTTPPSITSVNPLNNAVNVSVGTNISVTFSESVNPSTVTISTFIVTADSGGITVPGAVTCTGTTATFTPASPLAGGTTYTATITTGVRDLAGNAVDPDASWAFTTVSTPSVSPLAYYPFNGSAQDESGNNYDGVQSGDISYVAEPADTYARADGLSSDAYIDCGDINALDGIAQLTAAVWVKPLNRNNMDFCPIFSKEDSCSNGFGGFNLILSRDGEILWSLSDASGHALTRISPAGTVNLDEWQQITVVFDGSQSAVENKASIYINGTKVRSTFYESNNYPLTITYASNVSSLWIARGRGNSCGYSYFDGYMNELRFYTRVMLESEIRNLYSQDWQKHYESASAWQVTTLAGSPGIHGTADGTGSAARFYHPLGMAVDGAGTIYIGDYYNSAVRKVTPAGVVTTLAGVAGSGGYLDGTGAGALFSGPAGVAVDSSGNVYVADSANFIVRKISPEGVVTTLAGLAGTRGSADGAGTAARFYDPAAVAVDHSGNVYVSDAYNNTIRKITPEGVVSTLAGTAGTQGGADGTGAAARFYLPANLVVDHVGNVYVADSSNHTIRKITPEGVVTTVAGLAGNAGSTDGTGSTARFNTPYGLCMDPSGNLYVGDNFNHTLRKITPSGVVTTIAGAAGIASSADGDSLSARFNRVIGVAIANNGTIYVNDYMNHTVRKLIPYTFVSTEDSDNDGLSNATELLLGTDPDDADTDDDGILDGQEDSNHNGTVDLWETNPLNFDTDGDGIQDGTELGVTYAMVGPDTDLAFFQPDLDPATTTSAVSNDTDGDGINDGVEDTNHNGRVDDGENDPNVANQAPVANAGDDQTIISGVTVALDGSASTDPDNNIISYHWQQVGGPVVELTNINQAIAQFTANAEEGSILTFVLTVTDSGGMIATDTCIITVSSITNHPGDLDQTFGNNGWVSTPVDEIQDIAIQPDGKILIMSRNMLARHNINGSLDSSFGLDGIVDISVDDHSWVEAMVIQPDGKIVVVGSTYIGNNGAYIDYDNILIRYNTDGSPDTGFGVDGQVTTYFSGDDRAHSVAIQSNGSIVVGGSSYYYHSNTNSYWEAFALARYNSDGSLDNAFGSGGKVITEIYSQCPAHIYSIAIQSDGKILAAGDVARAYPSYTDFVIVRYNNNGSLDGRVTTDFFGGNEDVIRSVMIESTGKVIAGGYCSDSSNINTNFYGIARYNGLSLDTSFDLDGRVTISSFGFQLGGFQGNVGSPHPIAMDHDGRIVAVGLSFGYDPSYGTIAYLSIVRHNNDGSLDTSFGTDGKVAIDIGQVNGCVGNAIALQSDGKILAAGYDYTIGPILLRLFP